MDERIPRHVRKAVAERASFRCEYCHTPEQFSADPLSIEHSIPKSRGGSSELDNLSLCCQGCNNYKHTAIDAMDPVTMRLVPLFNPRLQEWDDHFAWNASANEIIAMTATGRATLDRLRLNRQGVVGLRKALAAIGQHPPGL